jgi:hypothetical protein
MEMTSKERVTELQRLAKEAGLELKKCTEYHYQLLGGALLVNYYPAKGNAYISQTSNCIPATPAQAIQMTNEVPKHFLLEPQKRGKMKKYKKAKDRMWDRKPYCNWCNVKLKREDCTLDHVVPLSRGGLDNANNWVLSCEPCNRDRGNKMPEVTNGSKSSS